MKVNKEKNGKIGVFDSGIGGVTVLREIIKILPQENYIYYSDSKNNPYGDKTDNEIEKICDNIIEYLIEQDCKLIVIACNTASAKVAKIARKKYFPLPFIAIEPAYKMVYDYAYNKPTLVMATQGTIESEKFNLLLKKYDNHKTYLLSCSGLADRIEVGNKEQIKKYLDDHIAIYKGKVENVVLGCTHYPLIQKQIEDCLGANVQFFNGAPHLAKHLKNVLQERNLLNDGEGNIEFVDSQNLEEKKERFFKILNCDLFTDTIHSQ